MINNKLFKKAIIVLVLGLYISCYGLIFAQNTTTESTGVYTMLAPLPGIGDGGAKVSVATYISGLYKFSIIFASVMAVIMIVIGGIQYMTSESMGNKSGGKDKIQDAIYGLIMIIGSYVLLQTINPNFVEFNIDLSNTPTSVRAGQVYSDARQQAQALYEQGQYLQGATIALDAVRSTREPEAINLAKSGNKAGADIAIGRLSSAYDTYINDLKSINQRSIATGGGEKVPQSVIATLESEKVTAVNDLTQKAAAAYSEYQAGHQAQQQSQEQEQEPIIVPYSI